MHSRSEMHWAAALAFCILALAGCQANQTDTLALRSAGEVGAEVRRARGPGGEPAIEIISHTSSLTSRELAATKLGSAPFYMLTGRLKCEGVVGGGTIGIDLGQLGNPPPSASFTGDGDWQDFGFSFSTARFVNPSPYPEQPVADPSPQAAKLFVQLSREGKVTIAEPLVLVPQTRSDDGQLQPAEPAIPLAFRSVAEIGSGVVAVQGPADEPAMRIAVGARAESCTVAEKILPRVTSPDFVVRGRVKYDCPTPGSLDMLCYFGNKTYSTRAVGTPNPAATLTGTSDWRDFELAFHAQPGMIPERLKLNINLPSGGEATVCEPLVVESIPRADASSATGQAVWIGVAIWAFMAIPLGLAFLSAAQHKPLLAATLWGTALGICLAADAATLATRFAGERSLASYPLLISSLAATVVALLNLRGVTRCWQSDELRRITAADVV